MEEIVLLLKEEIKKMKDEMKIEMVKEIKNELNISINSVNNHRKIGEIARTVFVRSGRIGNDMYQGAFSTIIRNLYQVSRLEHLNDEQLEDAIKLSEEIADVILKYKNKEMEVKINESV